MTEALLQLKKISKRYWLAGMESLILNAISLTVEEGELLAIVGASGSGKSTLMNILGLLEVACEGEYWLAGRDVARLSSGERASLRNQFIGFVFQQFNLLPRFTAAQNVALPLSYRSMSTKAIDLQVKEALARVGMAQFANYPPLKLSGGQQQRVAIARALVAQPRVVLADEPTGALDSRTGKEVMDLFHTLHQEGRTVILITHDEGIARQCSRRITLADGQVCQERVQ